MTCKIQKKTSYVTNLVKSYKVTKLKDMELTLKEGRTGGGGGGGGGGGVSGTIHGRKK